jgi:hypothetical protein
MKDFDNLHLKVQEHIDCYAQTDPLREMSRLQSETDVSSAALKWMALAALHGINANAEEIALTRHSDGHVAVSAKYRPADLPSPGDAAGGNIVDLVRGITHITDNSGQIPLALGIRDSSIELRVKIKRKEDREKITLKFPRSG